MKYLLIPALLLISCSESPRFLLLSSKQTGIDFNNTIVETDSLNIISYENIYNGAGIGTGDLNNDGFEDIIFAGNQVVSRIYLNMGNLKISPQIFGYYDANKGIVLMNKAKDQEKGKPVFELPTPSQSGLMLQGMVGSLLYLKGHKSLVIAGINRAKVSVFGNQGKSR